MTYKQYAEYIKKEPPTESLKYALAVPGLHTKYLPLSVVSVGEEVSGIVKIPDHAKNKYGITVSVIAIARNAFSGNKRITDIILPESIRRLSAGTFSGCTALKRITIPENITKIEEGTFENCDSLEDIYFEGTPEDWKKVDVVHSKHEIVFGNCISGTPVHEFLGERLRHIPGNDAVLRANIHFRCSLTDPDSNPEFKLSPENKDLTAYFIS